LLFASAREIVGKHQIEVNLDGSQTMAKRIRERIIEMHPGLSNVPFVLAINRKVPAEETWATISPTDEVAVLPPISGG